MEVKLAKTAGYCFGVKRAVNIVNEEIEKESGKKIFTYGPIIHNGDVIKHFKERGVYVLSEDDEGTSCGEPLIIRAHGVSRKVLENVKERGFEVIDATCPFVKKIHNIVYEKSNEGHVIIVCGDRDHPEVIGITGWIDGLFYVAGTEAEAKALPSFENREVTVVFQTTFDVELYKDFVEIIGKKGYHINVMNTICNATCERQNEAALISKSSDVMLVIGDKKSANTNRLFEICRSNCKDTYFIQKLKDLEETSLQSGISVGITAGASTPEKIIQEVLLYVRGEKF